MPEQRNDPLISRAGNVGKEPESRYTPTGTLVCNFSLAVPAGYGDDAPTTWYDVSVWNESLIASVLREVHRGSKVAVEGFYSERENQGKTYKRISAARVGLVDWLQRAKGAAAPAAGPAPSAAVQSEVDW